MNRKTLNRANKIIVFASIMFAVSTNVVSAVTYYVNSGTGIDTNAGTSSGVPWKTIQANKTNPGDTILVFPGAYDRTVISKGGTAGSFVTIMGVNLPSKAHVNFSKKLEVYTTPYVAQDYPGDTTNNAVIKGLAISAGFIRIENFEVTGGGGIRINSGGKDIEIINNFFHDLNAPSDGLGGITGGAADYSNSNILIKGNTLFRTTGTGILMWGTDWIVEGNEISHIVNINTATGVRVGGEDAIRPFGSGHIIRKNYIHDIVESELWHPNNDVNTPDPNAPHEDCFQLYSLAGTGTTQHGYNILIEKNYCENIMQMFISRDVNEESGGPNNLHDITIRNNIFRGAEAVSIIILDYTDHIIFENNVVAPGSTAATEATGLTYSGLSAISVNAGCTYVTVRNNIFYTHQGRTTGDLGYDDTSALGSVWDYNLHNINFTYPAKNPAKYGAYDLFGTDPKFVNAVTGDFHLQSGSPAIDAGDPSFVPSSSCAGTRIDIGAYEFGCPDDWSFNEPPASGTSNPTNTTGKLTVYPNPVNLRESVNGTIKMNVSANSTIKIYNTHGELITTIISGTNRGKTRYSGGSVAYWDGTNDINETVSSGIYFAVSEDNNGNKLKGKIALIK